MKNIILSLGALFCLTSYAQVAPSSSPYNSNGPYTVVADSNETISPNALWYRPQSPGSYPVFMFQPGANGLFGGSLTRHSYDLFMQHLASWGYVVVIVDETSAGLPDGSGFTTVYDWFIDGHSNGGWQANYADLSKFAIGGHSNGGVNATNVLIDHPNDIDAIVYSAAYPSDNFLLPHDVSTYAGYVLSMSGSEDTDSDPADVKAGYDAFTFANCGVYIDFDGMGHGAFGDYDNSAQPVGSIGRADATSSVKHYVVSFLEYVLKGSVTAEADLLLPSNRLTSENEFETTCVFNTSSVAELEANVALTILGESMFLESDLPMTSVTVYDIQGRMVENLSTNKLALNISTNQLLSGTYMVQVLLKNNASKVFKIGVGR